MKRVMVRKPAATRVLSRIAALEDRVTSLERAIEVLLKAKDKRRQP